MSMQVWILTRWNWGGGGDDDRDVVAVVTSEEEAKRRVAEDWLPARDGNAYWGLDIDGPFEVDGPNKPDETLTAWVKRWGDSKRIETPR